jgi:hypothetical protein
MEFALVAFSKAMEYAHADRENDNGGDYHDEDYDEFLGQSAGIEVLW